MDLFQGRPGHLKPERESFELPFIIVTVGGKLDCAASAFDFSRVAFLFFHLLAGDIDDFLKTVLPSDSDNDRGHTVTLRGYIS